MTKHYPGVVALDRVDFDLRGGEVHVLFGENGAGKSTLISILAGASAPTAGEVRINGEPVQFRSVRDARARGISAVFQEFSLVPTRTVAENIFLGEEVRSGPLLDKRAMIRRAADLFRELDFDIDPKMPVSLLSRAEQQMVEIAKAFRGDLSILILDEPTASLSDKEADHLFGFIERTKRKGVGIIYISHRIHEFERIADRITVLRDGRQCGTLAAKGVSEAKLVELMAGRAIDEIYPVIRRMPGDKVLEVRGLHAAGVNGVDLAVRSGEVVGCAGLVGSGKSRLWRSVVGLGSLRSGRVSFKGSDITHARTRDILNAGLVYLPPDRKLEGLQMIASSRDNIVLSLICSGRIDGPFGLLSPSRARGESEGVADKVGLNRSFLPRLVSQLSGGNQQKVLFAKGFGRNADLYVFDEPTVGVDMTTRAALYGLIKDLAEAGKAVVVISSDLPEVMNLAHRVLVFCRGRITAELEGADIEEERILRHFFQFEQDRASA